MSLILLHGQRLSSIWWTILPSQKMKNFRVRIIVFYFSVKKSKLLSVIDNNSSFIKTVKIIIERFCHSRIGLLLHYNHTLKTLSKYLGFIYHGFGQCGKICIKQSKNFPVPQKLPLSAKFASVGGDNSWNPYIDIQF